MKSKPDFGTPTDECEKAAHAWLTENLDLEGESVMQSLGEVIRRFALGRLIKTPAPWESDAIG